MANPFQKLMRATANTRVGAFFYRYTAHHLDKWTFQLTKGRTTFAGWLGDMPIMMLTVVGRKSGKPYTVPLVAFTEPPDQLVVVASNWGQSHYPAWYQNLKAAGTATGELNGITKTYHMQELEGEAYAQKWAEITAILPNYTLYKRTIKDARHIPLILLTPEATP